MVYLYVALFTVVYWIIFWVAALWDIGRDQPINMTTDDVLIPLIGIWIVGLVAIIYFT